MESFKRVICVPYLKQGDTGGRLGRTNNVPGSSTKLADVPYDGGKKLRWSPFLVHPMFTQQRISTGQNRPTILSSSEYVEGNKLVCHTMIRWLSGGVVTSLSVRTRSQLILLFCICVVNRNERLTFTFSS